jgi:hypothetical protein
MKYPDDFSPFIDRLTYLATGLRADFTADRFDFYFEMLQDIPFENVCDAISTAGRVCEFFPTPAKLRELASETMSASDAAERAWERFRYALHHVPVYDTVDFGDPVLHAVIRSLFGGWPQTIEIQTNKLSFVRSDFLKSYVVFAKTGGLVPEPLLGLMPGPRPVVVPSLALRASLSTPRMLGQ